MTERTMTDGSPVSPDHRDIDPNTGLQKGYVVLSEAERAKGFVRPLRYSYVHDTCGAVTKMSAPIAETYATRPEFYTGTYCSACRSHFPVGPKEMGGQFKWDGTNEYVGT